MFQNKLLYAKRALLCFSALYAFALVFTNLGSELFSLQQFFVQLFCFGLSALFSSFALYFLWAAKKTGARLKKIDILNALVSLGPFVFYVLIYIPSYRALRIHALFEEESTRSYRRASLRIYNCLELDPSAPVLRGDRSFLLLALKSLESSPLDRYQSDRDALALFLAFQDLGYSQSDLLKETDGSLLLNTLLNIESDSLRAAGMRASFPQRARAWKPTEDAALGLLHEKAESQQALFEQFLRTKQLGEKKRICAELLQSYALGQGEAEVHKLDSLIEFQIAQEKIVEKQHEKLWRFRQQVLEELLARGYKAGDTLHIALYGLPLESKKALDAEEQKQASERLAAFFRLLAYPIQLDSKGDIALGFRMQKRFWAERTYRIYKEKELLETEEEYYYDYRHQEYRKRSIQKKQKLREAQGQSEEKLFVPFIELDFEGKLRFESFERLLPDEEKTSFVEDFPSYRSWLFGISMAKN